MKMSEALTLVKSNLHTARTKKTSEFICLVAESLFRSGGLNYEDQNKVKALMAQRMGVEKCDAFSLSDWLFREGHHTPTPTYTLMQDYRHAWLVELIKEFKLKGE